MPEKNIKDATIPQITLYNRLNVKPTSAAVNPANYLVDPDGNGWILFSNAVGDDTHIFARAVGGGYHSSLMELRTTPLIVLRVPAQLVDTTEPAGSAGTAHLWSEGGEAKIKDGSGNITTFSPHNIQGITLDPDDDYPTTIHHRNEYLGTEEWIYLSKAIREIEKLSGVQLIFSREIPKKDWSADETAAQQRRAAAIAAYDAALAKIEELPPNEQEKELSLLGERPQPYTKRTEPTWITQRKNKGR